MKSQDEKLESLLWAGDPARSVAERPVTTSERAAFVSQLVVHQPTSLPRRSFGLIFALAATNSSSCPSEEAAVASAIRSCMYEFKNFARFPS